MRIKNLFKKFFYKKKKSRFTKDNINLPYVFIGEFTYGVPQIYNWAKKSSLNIGKFCSIADNVKIMLNGNHRIDWLSTYPFGHLIEDIPRNAGHPAGKGDINIGNDVWIGRDVLILSGVTIGNGAVIAARAVVTKNVGDYEIVGGNPARHIRFRFNEEQIKALNTINWWNWSIEKVKENIHLLQADDVDEFVKKFG